MAKKTKASKSKATKPHLKPKARKSSSSSKATKPKKKPPAKPKKSAPKKPTRAQLKKREFAKRSKAAKKGAITRRKRRAGRARRGEIEARVVEKGGRTQAVYETLAAALDRMAESSGLDLEIRGAPNEGKTPWLVQGAFSSRKPLTYEDLTEIFATWESDYTLEATIHPRRVAWVRWEVLQKGKREGYAPGGIGEWNRVISEAQQSGEELAELYPGSKRDGRIFEVQVFLSAQTVGGGVIRL